MGWSQTNDLYAAGDADTSVFRFTFKHNAGTQYGAMQNGAGSRTVSDHTSGATNSRRAKVLLQLVLNAKMEPQASRFPCMVECSSVASHQHICVALSSVAFCFTFGKTDWTVALMCFLFASPLVDCWLE